MFGRLKSDMATPHVSLVAEPIIRIGGITITNSMVLGLMSTLVLIALLVRTRNQVLKKRYDNLTMIFLWGYEALLNATEEVIGNRKLARKLSPLAITMFFVIVFNNWVEILPILGPITYSGQPLFRGLAADLNFTLILAIITMVTAQVYAIRTLGFNGNIGRYFVNPFKVSVGEFLLGTFVGILEIIAEFSRLVALSMRLFGNIFGGEVLLLVIGSLTSYAAPIALPLFMLLELFVGAVQAYVFFMLTVVFVSLGASGHGDDEDHGRQTASVATSVA
jgi:F-type H+-transporting ATPase subunit a